MADAARAHVTAPAAHLLERLPGWITLVRATNPGPMTLDGTNTWILRPDRGGVVVVDPGPDDGAHLRAVAAAGPVAAILLTHGHPDHVGGLAAFRELVGPDVPVHASVPAPPVGAGHPGLRPLSGGAALRYGSMVCTPLITPGHTADSACFVVEVAGERVVLTGDTILGRGTTVVAWPDGNLADYLRSLDRLVDLGPLPVLPGHGPALADAGAAARFYREHRYSRLEQVRAAVAAGAHTPEEVTAVVYADVDPALRAAAQWSVRAQLAYLTSRGQP